MVTLVVLAGGIVFIYRSFFLCADYLRRVSARLYASQVLEQVVYDVGRRFKGDPDFHLNVPAVTIVDINRRPTDFYCQAQMTPLSGYPDMYRLEVSVRWMEGRHGARLSRQSVLAKI